jgi:Ca2+-binding RTX toxin-like protein
MVAGRRASHDARMPLSRLLLLAVLAVSLTATGALAKTSHEGWPKVDGKLKINKTDKSGTINGTAINDELLGGHGNDTLNGLEGNDILWGDYKPSGQGTKQFDRINGGPGNDFIYSSHGHNVIDAGPGNDSLKAHFGYGKIDCGGGVDRLYVSRTAQKKYKITRCETISHKTLGY